MCYGVCVCVWGVCMCMHVCEVGGSAITSGTLSCRLLYADKRADEEAVKDQRQPDSPQPATTGGLKVKDALAAAQLWGSGSLACYPLLPAPDCAWARK